MLLCAYLIKTKFPRYLWRTFAPHGEAYHFARLTKSATSPVPLHDHDGYAEICWVEQGAGWHRLNGMRLPLQAGDVLCVRAGDLHALETDEGGLLTIVNVAFPLGTLRFLRSRYFEREARWFWSAERQPPAYRVKPAILQRLQQAAGELAFAPRERFYIERFLLNILFELDGGDRLRHPQGTPDWLSAACEAVLQPDHFRRSVGHFFTLTGRSPEHAARMMRLHLNTTPSDYLNETRLNYATLQLQMTNTPVTQIAFDCGYENLSHFFHRFRRRFGQSPGAYRNAKRQDIV